ncbi:hypothetical protein ACQE5E_27715, partial [Klebsiella pneumoniae]
MGSCAAPSAKGDDKFITTDYLQQCPKKGSAKTKGRGRKAAQPEPQPQPPEGEDYGFSDDIPF